jgi:hypothetical protein
MGQGVKRLLNDGRSLTATTTQYLAGARVGERLIRLDVRQTQQQRPGLRVLSRLDRDDRGRVFSARSAVNDLTLPSSRRTEPISPNAWPPNWQRIAALPIGPTILRTHS